MPKATRAADVRRFTDIPNIGPAMARDFAQLGIAKPDDLAQHDGLALYHRLCELTRTRQDPCVLDTFLAAVAFMRGGPALAWWSFTEERKRLHPDI